MGEVHCTRYCVLAFELRAKLYTTLHHAGGVLVWDMGTYTCTSESGYSTSDDEMPPADRVAGSLSAKRLGRVLSEVSFVHYCCSSVFMWQHIDIMLVLVTSGSRIGGAVWLQAQRVVHVASDCESWSQTR